MARANEAAKGEREKKLLSSSLLEFLPPRSGLPTNQINVFVVVVCCQMQFA